MPKYTLAELAQHLSAQLSSGEAIVITGINTLAAAQPGQISFLHNPRYREQLATTKASAVIVAKQAAAHCPVPTLTVADPHLAYACAANLFALPPQSTSGIHPTAVVGADCDIAADASIGAHCVLGQGVKVGASTMIAPGCVLGDQVSIGARCHLYPKVTLYAGVRVGDEVICHGGVVIGSDGFGFANAQGQWLKIAQLGSVRIEDQVEIGANTTIDRGALEDTVIETGVKIDNQVQIAHNVHIGAHTIIAGCAGIAGSCKIGRYCMIGGQTAINGHIEICDRVAIVSGSTVANSIDVPGAYGSSIAAHPAKQWRRNIVRFQSLDQLAKRVQQLERGHVCQSS